MGALQGVSKDWLGGADLFYLLEKVVVLRVEDEAGQTTIGNCK